jgi:hypothetical protein
MVRIRPISRWPLSVLLFGVLLTASSPASEPPPWLEIHSTHFTVLTDADEKKGKEVALRFEQMRAVFGSLLTKDRLNDSLPLTILAFKNDKTYYQTAPLRQGQPINNLGFFLPGEDQNFIVLNLFEPEPWRAVAHDLAHLLLTYNYPPVPGWFDEGIAEYFSSIRVDNKQVEIGGDPELTPVFTQDLLENQRENYSPPKSLTELLGAQVWLALPDLLTLKHDTSDFTEGTHHTLFYAQSWMMIHYLVNQKKMPETGAFFDLVENRHIPVEDAIQKAYGMTSAQLDQAVKVYFHSLTPLFLALDNSKLAPAAGQTTAAPQPYQFPELVNPNDREISAKPLPEADARAIVGEVRSRIPDRRAVGMQELQALSATLDAASAKALAKKDNKPHTNAKVDENDAAPLVVAVGNEVAHRALAWDHIERKEFDAATEELNNAVALNPSDTWLRYYLSVLKYRMAESRHGQIVGLPNMIQDLRAVLEWYPEFANAYDLLAIAHVEGGGSSAAMQAEHAAMLLSPRNQFYVLHLAEIYIADKKWQAALAQLDRLKTSANPQVAAAARERLEQIPKEQKYGLSAASLAAAQKLAPQPSPFDVLEQDAAKRDAQLKATQSPTADTRPAKFLEGRLLNVDCSQPPVAILTVSSGSNTLKLRTPDYKSLLLLGADTFSCAWSNRAISINYKPGGVVDGDLLSVEVR